MLILTRYYGEVKNTPDSRTILLLLNFILLDGMSAAAFAKKERKIKRRSIAL